MPRRIVSATDYGFRKVFRVVMNDSIPEWIHPIDDDAVHTPDTARGPFITDPLTGVVTAGLLDRSLQAGTECHACVFNHDVREFIFTREEFQVEDPPGSGTLRNKTDGELVVEIQLSLMPTPPPIPIRSLATQII